MYQNNIRLHNFRIKYTVKQILRGMCIYMYQRAFLSFNMKHIHAYLHKLEICRYMNEYE